MFADDPGSVFKSQSIRIGIHGQFSAIFAPEKVEDNVTLNTYGISFSYNNIPGSSDQGFMLLDINEEINRDVSTVIFSVSREVSTVIFSVSREVSTVIFSVSRDVSTVIFSVSREVSTVIFSVSRDVSTVIFSVSKRSYSFCHSQIS